MKEDHMGNGQLKPAYNTQPFVDSMKRMLDTLDETLGTKAQ
jgi:hypothetical protein